MRLGADLLRRLKDETTEVHVAIERSVRFLDDDATLADYRDYLARLHGFYAPLEPRLEAHCSDVAPLELSERRKVQLLAADLRQLGLDAAQLAALPTCTSLPSLRGLQEALGCLYVIEGATLGGRFVYQRLAGRFAAELPAASSFLRGYGAATGERWRQFGAALAAHASDPARVVAAAKDTFRSLHGWLAMGNG